MEAIPKSNPFEFIKNLDEDEEIFKFSSEEYSKILEQKPWKNDPHYFKKVRISALSLVKMVTHTYLGGQIEVMGLMQGRADKDTIIICDSFPLPVEGTETRVNASAAANEYIGNYLMDCDQINRKENICGWYHSHPSYGCWLSGIDVSTQDLYQSQDPWLALVIDPIRTLTHSKVEIGAFRTYPSNYNIPGEVVLEDQIIPFDKIEDFGVHYKKYYNLEISYFKTKRDSELIDLLWNKYWIANITKTPLFTNRKYFTDTMCDLGKKTDKLAKNKFKDIIKFEDPFEKKQQKNTKDFAKHAVERNQAFSNEAVKILLFNDL